MILILICSATLAFSEVSEKDMDILYKNPPRAKKVKFGYILHKSSVKKITNQLYQFTLVQVSSGGAIKWNIRTDCGNKKLAFGCGLMSDKNVDHVTKKTEACSSGTFEPFEIPKDKDWKEVVRVFCERYNK